MKKKGKKKVGASFKQAKKHTDKPEAEKMSTASNDSPGPKNRADDELKHLMTHKPSGMRQVSRRTK